MAEIKIEKKKPIWPWILAALVLLAVVLFFVFNDRDETEEVAGMTQVESAEGLGTNDYGTTAGNNDMNNNGAVASYVQFVESSSANMGLDHEYSSEALSKLMAATEAKANAIGYDAKADLDKVKEYANKIETDPYETTHANSIRKAAEILAGTLRNMQQAEYPQLSNEATQLNEAASAINPEELTLDQKSEVKNYFEKAASLLQKMS
jgi:hypothetical protein